jgi:YggT family protein
MIKLADLLLQFYSMVLLVRVIVSFIKIDPKQPVVKFLTRITDPALDPVRKFIPPAGGYDFSVIIIFLIIQCLRAILQY